MLGPKGKRSGDAVMRWGDGKEEARTVASSESRRPNDNVEAREEVAEDALSRRGVGGLVAADFEGCGRCVLTMNIVD
jgi:uncharacterized protein YcbX